MKRYWIAILCILCLCCALRPSQASAMEVTETTEPLYSDNLGYEYINYHTQGSNSYLYINKDGSFTRVENYAGKVHIETYDRDFNYVSGIAFPREMTLFGGLHLGSEYNFMILGQPNPEEDPSLEVIRIVRFTKDWQRIDSTSFCSDNTSLPFRAGTVRCAEYNGYLYIHTSHRMFTYTDGVQHQSNLTINLRIADMTITDYRNGISNSSEGYISHSFNQFIAVDNGQLITVDHSDGAPRAVVLCRYKTPAGQDLFTNPKLSSPCEVVCALPIRGEKGDNYTGVAVGGFEISDTAYLIAGNTVAQDETYDPYGQRNVFITATQKDTFSSNGTAIHYLTDYKPEDGVTLSNVHLVKVTQFRYMVMWNETSSDTTTLRYALVDGNGNLVSQIYTGYIPLSNCKPIVTSGKIMWYTAKNGLPVLLSIDLYTMECTPHNHFYEYTFKRQAWYSSSGLITGICDLCGEGCEVIIPAVSDCPEEFIITPTSSSQLSCTQPGNVWADWIKLDRYNIEFVSLVSFKHPALGHDYQTVTTEATCTQDGKHTKTCSRCNDVQEEPIPATGHSYESTITRYPGCTNDGTNTFTCQKCSHSYTETLPPAGHSYQTHEVIKEPGMNTVGAVNSTCAHCHTVYVSTLPPFSAGVAGYQVVLEPTCTQAGAAQYVYTSNIYGTVIIEDTITATGHRYQMQTIPGDCVTDGQIIQTCESCGSTTTEVVPTPGHSFTDGKCTICGAADPDYIPVAPVISLKYPTLVFEDMVLINVYFSANQTDNVVQMGLITFNEEVSQWSVDNAQSVIPGYTWSEVSDCFYTTTNGIAAKNLGDEIYFAVYAMLSDGTYTYSRLVSYSPKTYAYRLLTSGEKDMKSLAVAMLNYGAAAQSYFQYNTDHLVNAGLTADQKALVRSYDPEMISAVSTPSSEKQGSLVKTGGYVRRYPTVSFEGAFGINYYFTPSAVPHGTITMYYWDQAAYDAAQVLTTKNASAAITMTGEGTDQYHAAISGIAAKDLDKGVYVCFVYSDGTTEYCSGVLAYSIGTYCSIQASGNDSLSDLAAATAVYGYHARIYMKS